MLGGGGVGAKRRASRSRKRSGAEARVMGGCCWASREGSWLRQSGVGWSRRRRRRGRRRSQSVAATRPSGARTASGSQGREASWVGGAGGGGSSGRSGGSWGVSAGRVSRASWRVRVAEGMGARVATMRVSVCRQRGPRQPMPSSWVVVGRVRRSPSGSPERSRGVVGGRSAETVSSSWSGWPASGRTGQGCGRLRVWRGGRMAASVSQAARARTGRRVMAARRVVVMAPGGGGRSCRPA